MAYIPATGSVVAFQSDPTQFLGHTSVSGTLVATQLAGSVLATSATITPAANQSVSGTIQAELLSTNASVITVGGAAANQSVSGTVGASIIGTIPVTGVIPGTGATNLGKAEDAVHSSGDVGVVGLSLRQDSDVGGSSADATGDYAVIQTNKGGFLKIWPNPYYIFDNFSVTTGWSVFNDDTDNLTTSLDHILGTASLSFDKVNGSSNTVNAIIQKTISSADVTNILTGSAFIQSRLKIPSLTDVVSAFVRLGTDSTNYNEWKLPVASIADNEWFAFRANLSQAQTAAGNGWDTGAITYIAVGVEFAGQNDTLAGILWDSLSIIGGQLATADITGEATISSAKVDLQKINGSTVDKGSGVIGNGTQRVVLATDQPGVRVDGSVLAVPTGNQSVSGAVNIGNLPVTQNVSGSIAAWLNSSDASVITVGSPVANQSVSGTVGTQQTGFVITSISGGYSSSIVGTVPVTQSTTPWTVVSSINGGIFPISGSVSAVITNANVNVGGSVIAQIASSVLAVVGSVATHIKSGSVIAVLGGNTSVVVASGTVTADIGTSPGSVVAFQGAAPWAVTNVGSIISLNVGSVIVATQGSVAAIRAGQLGTVITSISGIPQASVHGYVEITSSVLTVPAFRASIQGVAAITNTSVTTLVAAGGAGLSNQITDIVIANTGAAATLVTFKSQGGASTLGYTIAPAGGGSNIRLIHPMATPANQTFDVQATTATSTLYATVKGFKA